MINKRARFMLRSICIFVFIALAIHVNCHAESVTLTLKTSNGVSRAGEYVRRGIPLSINSGCTSTSTMRITDSNGNNVDAQFDIISRWDTDGDGADSSDPVRVVLVTFAADVNGVATYYFHTTGGSGNASGSNLASDETGYVGIDTGQMQVRIKDTAGFNFIEKITVDSVDVVSSPLSDGIIARVGGNDYSSYNSDNAPTVTIHYNGPLMACVSVEGKLETSGHVELTPSGGTNPVTYKAWFWFYKNSRTVYPTVSIKNQNDGYFSESGYGTLDNFEIDYLYIRTTLTGLGTPSAVRIGPGVVDGAAFEDTTSPSGVYTIDQNHPAWTSDSTTSDDFAVFSYNIGQVGSTTTESSDRWNSYASIRDSNRGLMVSGRWFWENYWKEIRLDADNKRIDFYLWADETHTHTFLGGSWKTHELQYNFHGNVASNYSFSQELGSINDRIRVFVSSEFTSNYSYRRPSPELSSSVVFAKGEQLQNTINYVQRLEEAYFDGAKTDSGTDYDFDDYRRYRSLKHASGPFANQYNEWYGWLDFGDGWRDGGGKGSQNYDWIWLALNAGLTAKSNYYLDLSDQFARHYGDMLIIHNPSSSTAMASSGANIARVHGGQRGEADALGHKNSFQFADNGNEPSNFGHTWYGGFLWHYFLNGDPWYRDVAEHMGDHVLYNFTNLTRHAYNSATDAHCNVNDCYTDLVESRQYSPGIDAAVNLYKVTGEIQYLNAAIGIFDHAILNNEVSSNGFSGFQLSPGTNNAHTLYENIVTRNLIYLYHALVESGNTSKAADVYSYLSRQANYYKDMIKKWTGCTPGTYTGEQYCPYQATLTWNSNPSTPNEALYDSTYLVAATQAFAFMYYVGGDTSWRDLARTAWKDGHTYPFSAPTLTTPDDAKTLGGVNCTGESSWFKKAKNVQDSVYFMYVENTAGIGKRYRFRVHSQN